MHRRNISPVTTAVRPVRPPTSTPAADSIKVEPVEVPIREGETAAEQLLRLLLHQYPEE